MAANKGKKERSPAAKFLFDDPWRKLLALALGYAAWFLISSKIMATKELHFLVTDRAPATGLHLEIPTPQGFILWKVNDKELGQRPKVRVVFEGPSQRIQRIPESLRLSLSYPEAVTAEKRTLEVGVADLTIPKHPEFESLLKSLHFPGARNPSVLKLDFEHFISGKKFALDRGSAHREIVVENGDNLPEGYVLDEEKGITFEPQVVRLSGPEILIKNLDTFDTPDHRRRKLLEPFTLLPGMPVRQDQDGLPTLVQEVQLAPYWNRLEMHPTTVKARLHLKQEPYRINYPDSLPVDLVGPGKEKWEAVKEPTRSVMVDVFDRRYWWREVNQVIPVSEDSKENPAAQSRWVEQHVRLVATTADIGGGEGGEIVSVPIHAFILPLEGETPPRADVIIEGREKLELRRKAEKKKEEGG